MMMKVRSIIKPIASLRLTVFCLGLGMILIFAATLDQVNLGIHAVEKKYFQSLFAFWQIPGAKFGGFHLGLPLPGGYLLGGVVLVNLLAAHISRFKMSWKKSGIFMIHIGVVLLIVGEILRGLFADETRMRLDEGATRNYSEALREFELAIVDTTSDPQHDQVVAVPERLLKREGQIQHPALPFTLQVQKYFPNSELDLRSSVPDAPPSLATAGVGGQLHVSARPRAAKLDEFDVPSAFVELRSAAGTLGTWLLSSGLREAQSFQFEGKTYQLALRERRDYKPFAIKLLDFTHDRYAGTDIPKNFSSRIVLGDPAKGEDREILIYMNNPLRYGGYTFYQASFDNADTTSILQVVKNPAWQMPYVACVLVGVGLIVQFSLHLRKFASSRSRTRS